MKNDRLQNFTISQLKEAVSVAQNKCIGDDFLFIDETIAFERLFRYPYRIDALGVVLVTGGSLRATVNLKEYRIEPGMALVYMPNNIIQAQADAGFSARGFILSTQLLRNIQVDIKNVIPLFMQLHDECCVAMDAASIRTMDRYMRLLQDVVARRPAHTSEITRGLIAAMIYDFCDMLTGSGSELPTADYSPRSRRKILFNQFMQLLSEHHCSQRSVGFYAERLCITPKYLSSLIKEASGRSAAQWIDDFVILEAKTLLKYSDMSVQQIAYHLNFTTQSFFGKYFKHQTGLSPTEYKMQ